MKQKKRWFAYLPLDRKGVEAYLNDQAEKGWALAAEQDGMTFRVPFQETNRTDLRYHVTCDAYQGEKLAESDSISTHSVHGSSYCFWPLR